MLQSVHNTHTECTCSFLTCPMVGSKSINWIWRFHIATLLKSSFLDFFSVNQRGFIASQSCSIGSIWTMGDVVQYMPLNHYSTFTQSLPCLQVTFGPQRAFSLEFLLTLVLLLLRTFPTNPLCLHPLGKEPWQRATLLKNPSFQDKDWSCHILLLYSTAVLVAESL